VSVKRLALGIGLAVVLGFLAIQLVPYGRNHTNPPVLSEPAWDSAATRATALVTCFDCHSNQTVWPWYSNIAPISWLVQHDVDEGRQALNFSEWGNGQEGGDSAETVSQGRMPPFSYILTHPNAKLSAAEHTAFIRGLVATFGGGN
jgi:mono/diheme cytochrome c family protein